MGTRKTSSRIPVVWKKKPLMPMRWRKAKRLCKEGKAVLVKTKDGIWYLKLKVEPSGTDTQDITLGLDTGSHFDGISVVSSKCHHENIELLHNKTVKDRMNKRRGYRRFRRHRLRHRKCRVDSRTSEKMVPTIRSMVEFRKHQISELLKLYPISKIVIEDVGYQHWGDKEGRGAGFSQVEIGKTELYNWVRSLGIPLTTVRGYITKNKRISLFGEDLKCSNKGKESFFAHCLDSFALATIGQDFQSECVTATRFIKKIWMNRRELTRSRCLYKDRKYYFRYKKGGSKEYFTRLGKSNICRVKPEGEHSNHPEKWEYIDNGRVECFKYNKKPVPYGGTIAKGQSRSLAPSGTTKRAIWNFNLGEIIGYRNRSYQLVY